MNVHLQLIERESAQITFYAAKFGGFVSLWLAAIATVMKETRFCGRAKRFLVDALAAAGFCTSTYLLRLPYKCTYQGGSAEGMIASHRVTQDAHTIYFQMTP